METADQAPFHIVQVQAWIQKNDKFLLARRGSKEIHQPGVWALPGGKVEHQEGDVSNVLEQTLQQEIREEVGLEVENNMRLLTNRTFIRSDGANVVSLTFLCQWQSAEAQALEDTAEVAWFTLAELHNLRDLPEYMGFYLQVLADVI